ncbi:sulfatase-like hydrolase/transferase [Pusillimonas sp. TS35]|nr:sulfatase-like hydrolase/transferase [Pusillimonas sp. TS35]
MTRSHADAAPVNFLLIITDQHRADHLGCYGNPIVQTPNLDSLARRGWRAGNMHVATPICMPNRASLMTGRYPSTHGARHNGIPLSLRSATFVDALRGAGYRTALIGKAHLQNMTDIPPSWPVRAEDRLAREAVAPEPGNYSQEKRKLWLERNDYDLDYPYYGFEQARLVDDHSDDVHGHYRYWLRRNHPKVEALIGPDAAIPAPDYVLTGIRQAWRTRVPEELYPSAYIGDETIREIRAGIASDKPFFIQCSFPDPHHPFAPPGKYWDMYRPDDIPLPASFNASTHPPPHIQWLREKRDNGTAIKHTPAIFACNEREAREAIALNYGAISNIDNQIGRILAALQESGQADNTVVIFTSDHGDYLGDHQLLLKGPIHYRGLTRVPFIWADPTGRAAGIASEHALASTIDIAPTILARASVAPFNGMQGKNMLPLMDGTQASLRDALIVEEEGQRVILGFDARIRCRTLLRGSLRLTVYDGTSWGELYDLDADPHETRNLWADPAAAPRKAAVLERLSYAMLAHVDTSPYPTALA